MKLSTDNLSLAATDFIDLQLHTIESDGEWKISQLIEHLSAEGFSLGAITDHDRADTAVTVQQIALEKQFPMLVAVEVSSWWKDNLVDFLCYGFDPEDNALLALSAEVTQRRYDNSKLVLDTLRDEGFAFSDDELEGLLKKPSAQHVPALISLVTKYNKDEKPIGRTLLEAGFAYQTIEPARIVAAAHASDAICILAHPGRDDGFTCFDEALLDELRVEAPVDGIEAYYPKHSKSQTQLFLNYAQKHNLLLSSGSDSHNPDKPPIKYPAENALKLLACLGIQVV